MGYFYRRNSYTESAVDRRHFSCRKHLRVYTAQKRPRSIESVREKERCLAGNNTAHPFSPCHPIIDMLMPLTGMADRQPQAISRVPKREASSRYKSRPASYRAALVTFCPRSVYLHYSMFHGPTVFCGCMNATRSAGCYKKRWSSAR